MFDFGRLQAWAWFVLFPAFAVTVTALLAAHRGRGASDGPLLAPWARGALTVLSAALLALALGVWFDLSGASRNGPFKLPPLGGRIAGCWLAFLATLAAWAAWRGRRHEARLPVLTVSLFAALTLVAAARNGAELAGGRAPGYLAGAALVLAVGMAVLAAGRQRAPGA